MSHCQNFTLCLRVCMVRLGVCVTCIKQVNFECTCVFGSLYLRLHGDLYNTSKVSVGSHTCVSTVTNIIKVKFEYSWILSDFRFPPTPCLGYWGALFGIKLIEETLAIDWIKWKGWFWHGLQCEGLARVSCANTTNREKEWYSKVNSSSYQSCYPANTIIISCY